MHSLQGVTEYAASTDVQSNFESDPPKLLVEEVGETTAEIVPIFISNHSTSFSYLPMHTDDPSVPDTPIIHPSGDEFGKLYEILGANEGSLRRHQSELGGVELGGDL
ncbi:unnamed protein product, partial [Ilex paraguariensis]